MKKPIFYFVLLTNSTNFNAYASKANLEWKRKRSQKFRIVQKSSNYQLEEAAKSCYSKAFNVSWSLHANKIEKQFTFLVES